MKPRSATLRVGHGDLRVFFDELNDALDALEAHDAEEYGRLAGAMRAWLARSRRLNEEAELYRWRKRGEPAKYNSFCRKEAVENPVIEVEVTADPPGNPRVLWISFLAFSLGFAVWGMFSALAPFLIKWYAFSPTQVLVLAAMEPFFAAAVSIPLGILTDKFGGRTVFTLLLLSLTIILFSGLFAEGYYSFLLLGSLLGLGGAAFVVGNAHVSSWYPESKQGTALGIFAVGNIGITVGMMAVTLLVTRVLNGPDGWRLIFPIFAVCTLLMALVYWLFTSDSPYKQHHGESLREIVAVYRSGVVVWLVAYLYWVAFGTLTFFASAMPTSPRCWWSASPSPGRWAAGWPTISMP